MNVQFLVPFGLFLLMSAAVQAQPEDKVTWRLKTEANNAALAYGIDNPEGTPIATIVARPRSRRGAPFLCASAGRLAYTDRDFILAGRTVFDACEPA